MREVDAFDGVSARLADQSAITYQVEISSFYYLSFLNYRRSIDLTDQL